MNFDIPLFFHRLLFYLLFLKATEVITLIRNREDVMSLLWLTSSESSAPYLIVGGNEHLITTWKMPQSIMSAKFGKSETPMTDETLEKNEIEGMAVPVHFLKPLDNDNFLAASTEVC